MSRDAEAKNLRLYDRRTIERNIKKGLITRKDYEKFLKSLDDAKDKGVMGTELPEVEDQIEDDGRRRRARRGRERRGRRWPPRASRRRPARTRTETDGSRASGFGNRRPFAEWFAFKAPRSDLKLTRACA